MTSRPRTLLLVFAALLLATALLNAYAAACTSESKLPTEGEKEGQCNPALAEMLKCLVGKPIDVATGNLAEEQTDIAPLGGRGPALGLTRSYNSLAAAKAAESGSWGYGWTGPYSASLTINKEAETATVRQDNGSTAVFYLKEGKYEPPGWNLSSLVKSGENYIFTLPSQEALEFDKNGRLVKISDRHKLALTLTYNGSAQLETVKDAAGRALTFTYKEGRVESVKDPMGHVVKYAYEAGNLVKVTLPGEEKPSFEFKYDGSHRMTKEVDGRGNAVTTEFDGSGRVKAQADALERKRSFEYKETGGVKETVVTEPNGSKTLYKFNAMGEPTEVAYAQGTELAQTTKYEYNASYLLSKETDSGNHATTYGYDAEGNRTSEKDANENEVKWTYDKAHDLISETTPRGNTTTINRNAITGDVESIKRSAPESKTQETKYEYAENGDFKTETDPLGRKTTFEYDSYGNRKAETNAAGDKTTWGYDEAGRVTSEVSPRGNEEGAKASEFETKIERDARGRPIKETDPLGHETKFKYDPAGNLEVETNSNGHSTTYVYDAADQRTEVKAANGDVSKTAYDSMGAVKSKTDGNGKTTKYEHNLLGQLTETIDPLERKTIRKYDAAGNLKELKDPEGRTTTYTHDAGDRVKEVKFTEEATKTISYAYDKDGNVTEMKDGTGTTKKAYDELNRLTEVKNGNSEVIKYKYDLDDQISEIVYPNGKAISRKSDSAGRLEAVKDWLGGETQFAYNRDSMLKSTTFPSGTTNVDEYEYDRADRIAKTTMKRGAETLASISYERDAVGQVKSEAQTGLPGLAKPEYGYDARERMTSGAGGSYEYDAAGNATELAGTSYSYDNASQLKEGGGVKYSFDNMGQRTKATPASGPATIYGYDQAGNLVSVKRPEEGATPKIEDSYAYDGSGLRMTETINGTTTHMAWDLSAPLPLLLSDGTNYYLYGPDGLPFAQIASETPTYLHRDQQGSTRLLTNSSGEAKGTYAYSPYGVVEGHTGTATTPLGYGGQYTSFDTGLIYLRARVYDPSTAQFMSVDPLVAETEETYGYAGQSPVSGGDPSGLCACEGGAQGPTSPPAPPRQPPKLKPKPTAGNVTIKPPPLPVGIGTFEGQVTVTQGGKVVGGKIGGTIGSFQGNLTFDKNGNVSGAEVGIVIPLCPQRRIPLTPREPPKKRWWWPFRR